MAKHWMHALGYHWKCDHHGQYVDGHECGDVIRYHQESFIPVVIKYEAHMQKWEKDGTTSDLTFPAREKPVEEWYHDKVTFYAHDCFHSSWKYIDAGPCQLATCQKGQESGGVDKIAVDVDGKTTKIKVPMEDARFADEHIQPLYFPAGHQNARKFKGMAMILKERGFNVDKLKVQCKGFKCVEGETDCCCHQILCNEPDFVNVPTLLEALAQKGASRWPPFRSSTKDEEMEANIHKALYAVPIESMSGSPGLYSSQDSQEHNGDDDQSQYKGIQFSVQFTPLPAPSKSGRKQCKNAKMKPINAIMYIHEDNSFINPISPCLNKFNCTDLMAAIEGSKLVQTPLEFKDSMPSTDEDDEDEDDRDRDNDVATTKKKKGPPPEEIEQAELIDQLSIMYKCEDQSCKYNICWVLEVASGWHIHLTHQHLHEWAAAIVNFVLPDFQLERCILSLLSKT
ncbi:hypothetical protein BS17DRAFT_765767 [Gyrodon lividus]|nr:hypothetical protein BS17DRAFT_765767 [Gyrodon lividus]